MKCRASSMSDTIEKEVENRTKRNFNIEGDHTATEGDYIIKGIKGEFYPCKPDIFEQTYEMVGDAE